MDVALVGTTCTNIKQVTDKIKKALLPSFNIVSVDADHHEKSVERIIQNEERLISVPLDREDNLFDDKLSGQYYDLALVNGNHYAAPHQIVFLDSKKEDSLKRRKDQLTDVLAYVKVDADIWPWLMEDETIPVFEQDQLDEIIALLRSQSRLSTPELNAVILAGGKSLRMGEDKSQLRYFNETQELHLAEICQNLGLPTFISKDKDGSGSIGQFEIVPDSFVGLGPFGAVLSAFRKKRNVAWLVVACDLPFIDQDVIKELIKSRDPSKFMTTLRSDEKEFGEPLAAIYEPRMYPRMLHALGLGYSCPTKVLRNSNREEIEVAAKTVDNINTKEEFEKVKSDLS
jgi:molybdopterin-guanine dinucleotide biosynthesis protein A